MSTTDQIPQIPPLARVDLYMALNLVSLMDPLTDELMVERAERDLVEDGYDSPHSRPWFVSYHASEFPGDVAAACSRYLVYRMMNTPTATGAMPPWVTSTGVLGKAGELDIVRAWFEGGRMLGVPEDTEHPDRFQLGFVDPAHWLTGSTDLAILPMFSTRPHIVEIKSKPDDVLVEMIQGRPMARNGQVVVEPRGPDPAHVRQLKATIGLARDYDWGWAVVCRRCWAVTSSAIYERLGLLGGIHPRSNGDDYCWRCDLIDPLRIDLEPPTTGEIYYWSRSWPRGHPKHGQRTKSFFYEHDLTYMERGRAVLSEAKQHFEVGALPPRRRDFQWSASPCQNCRFKPVCRLDSGVEPRKRKATLEPVTRLVASHAVEHARTIRPTYDYESTRARVLAEWLKEEE